MCDVIASQFLDNNVFGCDDATLNVSLETYCNDLGTNLIRFESFCLIPSTDQQISDGTICSITNKTENDWIFNQLPDGGIVDLTDLTILWESSLPLVGNQNEWVTLETGVTLEGVNVQSLQKFVMSSNGIILGTSVWPNQTSETFVMSNATNSLCYPIVFPDGASAQLGPNPLFAISSDGNVRVVGAYVYTTLSGVWELMPQVEDLGIIDGLEIAIIGGATYILWLGSTGAIDVNNPVIVYCFATANAVTTPVTFYKSITYNSSVPPLIPPTGGQRGFMAVQGNYVVFTVTIVDGNPPPFYLNTIVVRSIVTLDVALLSWSIPEVTTSALYETTLQGSNTCAVYGFASPGTSNYYLYAQNTVTGNIIYLKWNSAQTLLASDTLVERGLTSSPDGTWISFRFEDVIAYVYQGEFTSLAGFTVTPTQVVGVPCITNVTGQAGSSIIWFPFADGAVEMQTSKLVPATPATTVVAAPYQFYSYIMSVNDMGSSTVPDTYNPAPTWYLGIYDRAVVLGEFSALSRHNRYMLEITSVSTSHVADSFFNNIPHITGMILQRINEVYVIQQATGDVRIYQNGNLQVYSGTELFWETAMSDETGSATTFNTVSKTRPSMSQNGNYITYWRTDGSFRLCYYPYNNARFTDYCELNDSRFAGALTQQAEFCFANLQTDPDNPDNISFADGRCCCIGTHTFFFFGKICIPKQ